MTPVSRLRAVVSHLARPLAPVTVAPAAVHAASAPTLLARLRSAPSFLRTMASSAPTQSENEHPRFPLSPVPENQPIVRSAGMLVIGDEILNGKTRDTNSNFLAKMTFDLGIELKRIEVIADDEAEIVEAVRRMHKNYDWVVTCGGIGPTMDDISYPSVAAAFNVELEYDDETVHRMDASRKHRTGTAEQTEEQRLARMRMALFPKGAERFFVQEDMWVPVVRVGGKVTLFPGIPGLFERLVTGYAAKYVALPPDSEKPFRVLIHTSMPESSLAPFLSKFNDRVKKEGIRVGSYPKLMVGVDISLIGKDEARLLELADEVAKELDGKLVAHGKIGQEQEAKKQ